MIDVVIPWVNDKDPIWIKKRNEHIELMQDKKADIDKFYRDWDTLKFVLRGIDQFMPWVNNIFLLTDGQSPEWLNKECSKLKIIDHRDFFLNKDDLPVFNSHAIEANLIGIKDLANKFIYFNDDTLVLKPTSKERFFKNDKPLDYLVQDFPRRGFLYRNFISNDTFVDVQDNIYKLLNQKFKKYELLNSNPKLFYNRKYGLKNIIKNILFNFYSEYKWISVYHYPQPFCKENVKNAYFLFEDIFKQTSKSKFRKSTDINQYIYRFVNLVNGNFEPYYPNDVYAMVLRNFKSYMKERHMIHNVRFFCANDSSLISKNDYVKIKIKMQEDLCEILPNKSQFEK